MLDINKIYDEAGIDIDPIVLVPVNGKVRKKDIRRALNITYRTQFVNDIDAICKGYNEFAKIYEEYRQQQKIPLLLALFIVRHLNPDRKINVKGNRPDLEKEYDKMKLNSIS
jgi:hypothetical protein